MVSTVTFHKAKKQHEYPLLIIIDCTSPNGSSACAVPLQSVGTGAAREVIVLTRKLFPHHPDVVKLTTAPLLFSVIHRRLMLVLLPVLLSFAPSKIDREVYRDQYMNFFIQDQSNLLYFFLRRAAVLHGIEIREMHRNVNANS